jgi:hypothetical protein
LEQYKVAEEQLTKWTNKPARIKAAVQEVAMHRQKATEELVLEAMDRYSRIAYPDKTPGSDTWNEPHKKTSRWIADIQALADVQA